MNLSQLPVTIKPTKIIKILKLYHIKTSKNGTKYGTVEHLIALRYESDFAIIFQRIRQKAKQSG